MISGREFDSPRLHCQHRRPSPPSGDGRRCRLMTTIAATRRLNPTSSIAGKGNKSLPYRFVPSAACFTRADGFAEHPPSHRCPPIVLWLTCPIALSVRSAPECSAHVVAASTPIGDKCRNLPWMRRRSPYRFVPPRERCAPASPRASTVVKYCICRRMRSQIALSVRSDAACAE